MIIKIKREVLYQLACMSAPRGYQHSAAHLGRDIRAAAEAIAQATAEQHSKRPISIVVV